MSSVSTFDVSLDVEELKNLKKVNKKIVKKICQLNPVEEEKKEKEIRGERRGGKKEIEGERQQKRS